MNSSLNYSLKKYIKNFINKKIDGLKILSYYLDNKVSEVIDNLNITISSYSKFIKYVINESLKKEKDFIKIICPRSYFCLEGTATLVKIISDSSPQLCLFGHYCWDGAKYFSGTSVCGKGYNCPPGTSKQYIASFNIDDSKTELHTDCYPGSFNTAEIYEDCMKCPDGYECNKEGISWPKICEDGYFRSIFSDCTPCPKGTYSFEKGVKDKSLCLPCPRGKQCITTNINDPTKIIDCDEGLVCHNGVGTNEAYPCPNGYYCPKNTSPETQYDNKCLAGYVCDKGTTNTNKWQSKCPAGYFCPNASKSYINESERITKCPLGTISSIGLTHLIDCLPSLDRRIMSVENYSELTTNNFERKSRKLENYEFKSINYRKGMEIDDKIIDKKKLEGYYNFTKSNQNLIKDNELIKVENYIYNLNWKNLSKIEKLLNNISKKRLNKRLLIDEIIDNSNITNPTNDNSSVISYLNNSKDLNSEKYTNDYYKLYNEIDYGSIELINYFSLSTNILESNKLRQDLYKVSPININLGYNYTFKISYENPVNNEKDYNYFFYLEKNSITIITFDFRHLTSPLNLFIYNVDWEIYIEKYNLNDKNFKDSQKIPMPDSFLNKTNIKANIHEFSVFSYEECYININIRIYNGIFSSFYTLFKNTTVLEYLTPNRASLKTKKFFASYIKQDELKAILPVNLPLKDKRFDLNNGADKSIFKLYMTYNPIKKKIKNKIIENVNNFNPPNLYWGEYDMIGMPYLPFFSNCKNYGKYITIFNLFEQHHGCKFISEEETKFITDFSFGQEAIGDNCKINIDCLYDEDPNESNTYWFNSQTGNYLFSISKYPIEIEDLYKYMSSNEIVDVNVINNLPKGMIPGIIKLDINYFQKSATEKNIVNVDIKFEDPQDQKKFYHEIKEYKLIITFKPFNHTKLLVAFALSYTFYIMLYTLQGAISLILIIIFFIYHRIMARKIPKPKLKFFSYLPLILPASFKGYLISLIPTFVIVFVLSITFSGDFFYLNIFKKKCSSGNLNKNEVCINTIFDYIPYFPNQELKLEEIQKARLCTSLLLIGIIITFRSTTLILPNEKEDIKPEEDISVQDYFNWKRINFLFYSFLLVGIFVYFIILSFTPLWSEYIWYFIYGFKFFGVILEYLLVSKLEDSVLLTLIGLLFSLIQGLITFGSSTVVEFLEGSFIDIGILMIERMYLDYVIGFIEEYLPNFVEKFKSFFNKILRYDLIIEEEDDDKKDEIEEYISQLSNSEEEEEEENKEESEEEEENEFYEDTFNDICLINNESVRKNKKSILERSNISNISKKEGNRKLSLDNSKINISHIKSTNNVKDYKNISNQSLMKTSNLNKNENNIRNTKNRKNSLIMKNSSFKESENSINKSFISAISAVSSFNSDLNKRNKRRKKRVEKHILEDTMDKYKGYSSDLISYFINLGFFFLLWTFYKEFQIIKQYNITLTNFVFLYYFIVIVIPFNIIGDLIFYNLLENFEELPLHEFLDYMRWRFLTRKTFWARDGKSNPSIEKIDRNMEKLNFSSQYYFILSFYANGMIFVILSVVALILRNYNFLGDPATIIIFIYDLSVYYLVEMICIKIGKLMKIWHIKEEEENGESFYYFKNETNNYKNSVIQKGDKTKLNPIMSIKNWDKVRYLKEQEQYLEENLKTERMNLEITRNQFLNLNKKWLQANIGEILTPRTLVLNKKKIIDLMRKQYGEKSPNLSLDSIKLYNNINQNIKNDDQEKYDSFNDKNNELEKNQEIEYIKHLKKRNLIINIIQNPNLMKIISVWKNRSNFNENLIKNVGFIIKNKKNKKCDICGSFYNLRPINKLDVMQFFLKFIKTYNFTPENYDVKLFRHKFFQTAKIETICEICYYDRLNKKY